jgi:hypothetical protein
LGMGASHFRENPSRQVKIEVSSQEYLPMTPEDQKRLEACTAEIAEILHRNSDPNTLESLEGIEQTVRQQMLEHISPKVALFLSIDKLPPPEGGLGD